MKAKVLSGLVIAFCFLALQGLAISSLPFFSDVSGFWEHVAIIIAFFYIAGATYAGAIFTIKWWVK